MAIHPLLAKVQESSLKQGDQKLEFEIGDSVEVHVRFLEGDDERVQVFSGLVIARRGGGSDAMFTVRKIVDGEGVERVFPLHSPKIAKIEVLKQAVVRRAKLYYLRDRVGKKAYTLKERPITKDTVGRKRTRVKARKEKLAAAAADTAAKAAAKVRKPRQRKPKDGDAKPAS